MDSDPPVTGDPVVDDALAALPPDDAPLGERADDLERVTRALHEALDSPS